jgi:hypothetical protein
MKLKSHRFNQSIQGTPNMILKKTMTWFGNCGMFDPLDVIRHHLKTMPNTTGQASEAQHLISPRHGPHSIWRGDGSRSNGIFYF